MRLLRLKLPVPPLRFLALCAIVLTGGCQTVEPPREVTTAGQPSNDAVTSYKAALEALKQDKPEEAYALVAEGAKAGDAKSMFLTGFLQDIGAGTTIDHEKGAALIRAAAQKGDPVAAGYLGWRATAGFGMEEPDHKDETGKPLPPVKGSVEIERGLSRWIQFKEGMCVPNLALAVNWMLSHGSEGDPVAETNLATVFILDGWGVRLDFAQHLYWLKRAAEHGQTEAMMLLSFYYDLGFMVEQDFERATGLMRGVAEKGNAKAQSSMGDRFRDGIGVEINLAKAESWYRKAADQGDVDAMTKLGRLLREGGDGLAADLETAYRYLKRASDLGDTDAMTDAASMLELGEGVAVNTEEARMLLEKAAASGNDVAEDMLGDFAQNFGLDGNPDFVVAMGWYEKAAAKGNIHAMNSIGILHEMGRGVPEDHAKAFEWYEQAARLGDAWAQNRVGWMLKEGKGIEKDVEEAITWFKLAAEKGLPDAHMNLAAHYLRDLGNPMNAALAFEALCHYLREEEDSDAEQFLRVAFVTAGPAEREAIWDTIEKQVADPGLMTAKSGLAELLFDLLEMPGYPRQEWRNEQSAKLLHAMIASDRTASSGVIAWHYYIGRWVPFDLNEVRHHLQKGLDAGVPGMPAVEAAVDCACAPDDESRASARARLRDAADRGDMFAAKVMLLKWYADGRPSEEAEAAARYLSASNGLPPDFRGASVGSLGSGTSARRPANTISDDEFEARKAAMPAMGDRRVKPVFMAKPDYPFEFRESRLEGKAVVSLTVTPEGFPGEAEASESTHPLFTVAAVNAVRHWRFAPAIKDGKPVSAKVSVPFVFTFDENIPETPVAPPGNAQ